MRSTNRNKSFNEFGDKSLYSILPSRNRLYRWTLYICVAFVFISIIQLIVIVTGFPRNSFIGDFLINEEYLSPNGEIKNNIKLRQATVTILGVARDVGDNLEQVLHQIEILGSMFKSYQVLFVEGGSTDNTREIFSNWMKGKEKSSITIKFITTPPPPLYEESGPFKGEKMPREGRLAIARNIALDELSLLPITDYVIMIDMDILGWDINQLIDAFDIYDNNIHIYNHHNHYPLPIVSTIIDESSETHEHSIPMNTTSTNSSVSRNGIDNSMSHSRVLLSQQTLLRSVDKPNIHTESTSSSYTAQTSSMISTTSTVHPKEYSSHLWDVMCSNGIILHGVYRDTYAYRSYGLNTNHHEAGKDGYLYNLSMSELPIRRQRLNDAKAHVREVMNGGSSSSSSFLNGGSGTSYLLGNNQPKPIIRVDSCFAGLAIYRYNILEGCRYSYRHPDPPYMLDCEHVLFHQCIRERNHARIYSNPNMKLWYGHSPFKLPWSKLWKRVVDWLSNK